VQAELFRVDGETDRHDEANSRFSQFCEHAYKQVPEQLTDLKLLNKKRRLVSAPRHRILRLLVLLHYDDRLK